MAEISRFEIYGLIVLLLVCGMAIWRGGPVERRIAAVVAVAWVGSILLDDDASSGVQYRLFAIDCVLAVWLVAEAALSRRIWPAFAAAAQLMIVMTHVAFAVNARIVQEGFFSAYYIWSYLVLLALAIGVLTARPGRIGASAP